jgi:hypothetical protein
VSLLLDFTKLLSLSRTLELDLNISGGSMMLIFFHMSIETLFNRLQLCFGLIICQIFKAYFFFPDLPESSGALHR